MFGIFILGFLGVFAYLLNKNVRAIADYRGQIVHGSQFLSLDNPIEQRVQAMEMLDNVDRWGEFDIQTIYPQLTELQVRGHRFYGPIRVQTQHGEVHVFDWHFVSAMRKGYALSWFQTVVSFELEDRLIPSFNLRPKNLPLGVAIPGYDAHRIDGLDGRYQLDGPDATSLRRLFGDPAMLRPLNAFLASDKWHIDRYDNTLSISAFDRICAPRELSSQVQQAEAVVALLQSAAQRGEEELQQRMANLTSSST